MSNARNIARLQLNSSGQVTETGIADSAISSSKIQDSSISRTKVGFSGAVIQVQRYYNGTRVAMGELNSYTLWQVSFNKLQSNSNLVIMGNLRGAGGWAHAVGLYWTYGNTSRQWSGFNHTADGAADTANGPRNLILMDQLAGYSTAGNQTFTIGWQNGNTDASSPFQKWNPTRTTDDGRWNATTNETGSTLIIMEVVS